LIYWELNKVDLYTFNVFATLADFIDFCRVLKHIKK